MPLLCGLHGKPCSYGLESKHGDVSKPQIYILDASSSKPDGIGAGVT